MGGVSGRTGLEVARRLLSAPDVEIVAGVGQASVGSPLSRFLGEGVQGVVHESLEVASRALGGIDVFVDFTRAEAAARNAAVAPHLGIRPLVGTSGMGPEAIGRLRQAVERYGVAGAVVPNFALGSVRAKQLAMELAPLYEEIEIVECHGRHKRDKPSGTAKDLAEALSELGREVPIHSVRLSGMVAHQAVLFGAEGETITIRHDVTSRAAYAEGVLTAARALMSRQGLYLSLEDLLGPVPVREV